MSMGSRTGSGLGASGTPCSEKMDPSSRRGGTAAAGAGAAAGGCFGTAVAGAARGAGDIDGLTAPGPPEGPSLPFALLCCRGSGKFGPSRSVAPHAAATMRTTTVTMAARGGPWWRTRRGGAAAFVATAAAIEQGGHTRTALPSESRSRTSLSVGNTAPQASHG
jgi:hypothetical protein